MNREKAFKLLNEYVKTDSLIKHCLAVEASMIAYAKEFNEDIEKWSICGLLHDIDFEMYPETHPYKGLEILRKNGYSEDLIMAVKGHAVKDESRDSLMAKTLFAVDELSSFVVACALVRPTKLEGMKPKSVKKKFKTKSFAAAVDRDQIDESAGDLGVDMNDHLNIIIKGLQDREEELNKEGLSLL
ncbi:HDIG domain-containing protein [Clostridium sp. D2Q-11]|uniref:HDIG domain-containing protein n=1 Tax=Anaeromonas frigoriresistens TaxID=2683708 RepID=A0A942UVD4_9FIRM|nr:HDIG domain-containing metalloprotein [Anaeromonas frigoriresistens]MBS4537121.1 HDIG domain-containing protein [Anaeromonas frigoriresistens]